MKKTAMARRLAGTVVATRPSAPVHEGRDHCGGVSTNSCSRPETGLRLRPETTAQPRRRPWSGRIRTSVISSGRIVSIVAILLGAWTNTAATGDATLGATLFRACTACHSTSPGDHRSGPSLASIYGRKAGSITDFRRYSTPLREADIVWDDDTLDAWLQDPAALVPGNTMAYAGLPDVNARRDLIAHLRALSEGSADEGAATPPLPDLKQLPALQHIQAIRHCGDTYHVTLGDGETYAFWDFNLRFKTDGSNHGPATGQPVIIGAGMRGDRAQVVFSDPTEISAFIRSQCE